MLRVLLCIEDYGEMVFLQILLSKLGFDVGTLKNPKALVDGLYKMNPDVLVMTARGKRINGCELSTLAKKTNGKPKIVLLAPSAVRDKLGGNDLQYSEAVVESPVSPPAFIETIARLNNVDPEPLIEKYKRVKAQVDKGNNGNLSDPNNELVHVKSNIDTSTELVHVKSNIDSTKDIVHVKSASREAKYARFLKLENPPPQKSFSKQKVTDVLKEIRRENSHPDIDRERQDFVRAMFKKKA